MSVDKFHEQLRSLLRGLTPEERSAIGMLDLQRLKFELDGVSEETAAHRTVPIRGVINCLRTWHRLVRRMEEGWPGTDYYMVHEYMNDLTARDAIEEYVDAMPAELKDKVLCLVARVDERYSAVTLADGGAELAQYWRPLDEGRESRWWWHRKPTDLPPGW